MAAYLIGLGERLKVAVPETDYAKLVTLKDLMDYLKARLG